MGRQTNRQMILSALAMGGLFFMLLLFWSDSDIATAAIGAPIFGGAMYLSYRVTNRIAMRFRPQPPEVDEPEPPEPSSERPEHALRRRRRRRRRGARGRGTRPQGR